MSSHGHEDEEQAPAPHAADSHDLIRVHGARVNNLKDVSVEIPKRRLTVFTGVSGSGKSSLVFSTIAAESQRMINETYSAFVQGFMPTLARPEVDVLDGPDDRDHRRPAADGRRPPLHGRHRHRRQRDAAHPVQPARQALHRLAPGVLLQRRLDQRRRRGDPREGGAGPTKERRSFSVTRRHVPALRGPGQGQRHRPRPSCTTRTSRSTRARSPSPGTAWRAGTAASSAAAASSTRTSRSRSSPRSELNDLLYKEADQDQGRGHQPDLLRPGPADPEVVPVQGRRRDAAAHPRLRRAGGDVPDLPRLRRHPAHRGGPVLEDRRASASPTPARCRSATWPSGSAGSRSRRWRRCSRKLHAHPRLVRGDRAGLPLARAAGGHAVGR